MFGLVYIGEALETVSRKQLTLQLFLKTLLGHFFLWLSQGFDNANAFGEENTAPTSHGWGSGNSLWPAWGLNPHSIT